LLAVFALHAAVVTGLVINAWTRILPTAPTSPPLELLIFPRQPSPPVQPPPPVSNRISTIMAAPQPLPADTLIDGTANFNPDVVGPPIDWFQEAHNVAASIAEGAKSPEGKSPLPANSVFATPAPHYKGEQIPNADGTWVVYVSENCYQLSKDITYVDNKSTHGKTIKTYCNRRSKEPRGDLFKDLPAYKKYHPNN
jgi:hypothetical protein